MIVLGLLCLSAAIWFGLLMTGHPVLVSVWLRGGLVALIVLIIGTAALIRALRRRRAAQALEESLLEIPEGDGAVLAERMQEALEKLKKSGGATYLYDLPWYVIIGPPGAGKTTALALSGLEFPGTDKAAVAGFGGTKNVEFWFSEEAVLLDTAGRYTTQDSNEHSDRASWLEFLDQLKRARPNQPVNGIILAFSCEDMMTNSDELLDSHALTVRNRLMEIQEVLRIDVPVYVIFTKADLIAGFREYFGPFSEERRAAVWGVTFQTKDKRDETYKSVPAEFDALISRLSDEVTDRLNEEPDSVSRITIFGLPGQMAMLQRGVNHFLQRVFQKSADTRAILRGFYFTSGTQEGTPIDQVLGTIASTYDSGMGLQSGFSSAKGRSYFLKDLLQKVIFAERDWVGYDFRAMRRRAFFRSSVTTLIAVACLGAMGLFGYSFWKNATLVREARQQTISYRDSAQDLLAQPVLSDPDPLPILAPLRILRDMPGGFSDDTRPSILEGFGLSRRAKIRGASEKAYSDALERLLRPRLMLMLENELPVLVAQNRVEEAYRALKVYMIVAKAPSSVDDPGAVEAYFGDAWVPTFQEPGLEDEFDELKDHLTAMLALDDRVNPILDADPGLVRRVQELIASLTLAQQAYSSILSNASGISPLVLIDEIDAVQAEAVFRASDGSPLEDLKIPGIFTYTGYWSVFRDELDSASARLEEERWVLGPAADRVDYQGQLSGLNRDIHALYQADFVDAWRGMLSKIELLPMADPTGRYDSLGIAAAPFASPILRLAEAVDRETRLSRLLDTVESMEISADALASGDVSGQLVAAGFNEVDRKSSTLERIFLNVLKDKAKVQTRASGGSSTSQTQRSQVQAIERRFEKWHKLVAGDANARDRAIDALLAGLEAVLVNRRHAANNPNPTDATGLQDALIKMNLGQRSYPETIAGFTEQIEREFVTISINISLDEMKRALNNDIIVFCTQQIEPYFPFAGTSRNISTNSFGQFFGHGGRMDAYFNDYLRAHVQLAPSGDIVAREGSAIGARIAPGTLKQFAHAQAIRDAFFAPGAATPSVAFTIRHLTAHESVERSVVSFGTGPALTLLPNSTGATMSWPDQTSEIAVQLLPAGAGAAGKRFEGANWAIARFIRSGSTRRRGASGVDVTHSIGGRSVTFRMEFNSSEVPFLMSELRGFSCPKSLE